MSADAGLAVPAGTDVVGVDVLPMRIPYPTPRRFGRHVILAGDNILVRVHTSGGLVGYGEAVSRPYIYGESAQSIVTALREWLVPSLLGRSVFEVSAAWRQWDLVAQNPAAKAALDMAMHDLQAAHFGVPLWRWLGGTDPTVPLTWILTYADPQAMVDEAAEKLALGYRSFKLKVSSDEASDRRIMEALLPRLPEGAHLYVDANGVWDRGTATRRCRELAALGVAMVEDPLPTADVTARRALWEVCELPILGDETVTTPAAAAAELAVGGLDAASLKVFRTGFHRSRLIADMLEVVGRTSLVGGQGESHLGTVLAAHFASGIRGLGLSRTAAETSSALRFGFDLVAGGTPFRDGAIHLGYAAGSAVTLDEELAGRLSVDSPAGDGSGAWLVC